MRFIVIGVGERPPADAPRNVMYLTMDNWNDYFDYQTQYWARHVDRTGHVVEFGAVKIGQLNWDKEAQRRPGVPERFSELGPGFFSLGQDDDYYAKVSALGPHQARTYLRALRDVAYDLDIFHAVRDEDVTRTSLLREVSAAAVLNRLNRLAHGQPPLTPYYFEYEAPAPAGVEPLELSFQVTPQSNPPTNVHVLIGRNGAGKTRLLNGMTLALVDPDAQGDHVGKYSTHEAAQVTSENFANVVSVTFSAFDRFQPLDEEEANRYREIKYFYVGLKRPPAAGAARPAAPKGEAELAADFRQALERCLGNVRFERWLTALRTLDADPNFHDSGLLELAEDETEDVEEDDFIDHVVGLFERMSSGHSIVLLTITKLVEKVEERTLVLLDEPEAHLHPPLLSAFVRALSDLIVDRNGVAVIATHSPVVLQEVPSSCVWIIERWGWVSRASRPQIETFGENVGTLTREVFGLEVTNTGFNQLVRAEAAIATSYRQASRAFDDQLGSEAMGLLRTYLALERDDEPDR